MPVRMALMPIALDPIGMATFRLVAVNTLRGIPTVIARALLMPLSVSNRNCAVNADRNLIHQWSEPPEAGSRGRSY